MLCRGILKLSMIPLGGLAGAGLHVLVPSRNLSQIQVSYWLEGASAHVFDCKPP